LRVRRQGDAEPCARDATPRQVGMTQLEPIEVYYEDGPRA